jgi:hypothetical protein
MHALDPNVFANVALARSTLLAMPAAYVHFTCDVIAHANQSRRYVLADFDDLAAEFVADDYWLILIYISSVVDEHFISHTGPRGDLINALIRAAYRSRLDPDFHILMANHWLRLAFGEEQSILGQGWFLECLYVSS